MRVLIVGAGPAGLTLAHCLRRAGIAFTVVEKAAANRAEGYAVGLHVNGWNAAERLGLLAAFKARAVPLGRAEYRDPRGRRLFAYDYRNLSQASGGKMLAIMRDAVQEILVDGLPDHRIRYATTVRALSEDAAGVTATFSDGTSGRFDIVVGADGFRSAIRDMHFGPHERFLRPLGYRAAAWRAPAGGLLDASFVGMMDVDLQGGAYGVGDGTAAALFCWCDDSVDRPSPERKSAVLHERFGGWSKPVATLIDADIDWDRSFYDTIAQVEMPGWSSGRVVLLGDAAWCLTFLSGQGTSTAMAGAYILARELAANPYETAFRNYEARLRASTTRMQAASRRIGGHYVPESRLGLRLQSWILPLLLSPSFAWLVARRMLADELALD